jgi:hypothetical protein
MVEDTAAWIDRALDERRHFKREFITSQKWLVVPVESALHFDENDAARLADAARHANQPILTVILLEQLKNVEDNVAMEASEQGLLAFSGKYGHFNCMLVPRDLSFAIVCRTDDYYLVAGPSEFVGSALGMDIREAQARFAEFAGNETWSPEDRARLLSVHERYKNV